MINLTRLMMRNNRNALKRNHLRRQKSGFLPLKLEEVQFHGQAMQDAFVVSILKQAREGFYVEVGAFHSSRFSNTRTLEMHFAWQGVSFEIDDERVKEFQSQRSNSCVLIDATSSKLTHILRMGNLPKIIDYLQVDIEPPLNTLKALYRCLRSGHKFRVITFEHDAYRGLDGRLVRFISRCLLKLFGYVALVKDVHFAPGYPFEDWYVSSRMVEWEQVFPKRAKHILYSDIFCREQHTHND